jgi:AcrR family transcriptional regulator
MYCFTDENSPNLTGRQVKKDENMSTRRKDMRDQILQVAFELFTRQGYDKTSLREIAERLEVTKAALYYHFTSKEEILSALVAGIPRMFDELIAWSESLPRSVESRKQILRRLASWTSEKLNPVQRFVQANSTAIDAANVDGESMHEAFTPGLRRIAQILVEPGAELTDQVRAIIAVNLVMMGARPILPDIGQEATPEMVSEAVLDLALELVSNAGSRPESRESR